MRQPNWEPLLREVAAKEAELTRQDRGYAGFMDRLNELEVTPETTAMFARYVNGEWTQAQLEAAIANYLRK